VTLEITDDGAGLNYERIIEKALSKELVSHEQIEEMSEKELAMLIFRDDFSTEQNTDSVSGRGVGLSAVRANLLDLGGEIEVESVRGEYTSFKINFPK
jgi:two-component system chemotaxis sensor kinase CheA